MSNIKTFEEFNENSNPFKIQGSGCIELKNIGEVKKAFKTDEDGNKFEAVYITDPDESIMDCEPVVIEAKSAVEAFLKLYDKEGSLNTPLEGDHEWKKTKKRLEI